MKKLIFFVLVFYSPFSLFSQNQNISQDTSMIRVVKDLDHKTVELYKKGSFSEALELAENRSEIVIENFGVQDTLYIRC